MKETGTDTLKKEGITEDNIEYYPIMDLRYLGQYHEVQLPVPWDNIESFDLDNIALAFHDEHNRLFGYSLAQEKTEIEVINVRLRVLGITEKPKFLSGSVQSVPLESALKQHRQVYIPESNQVQEIPVYDGDLPLNGNTITGPAVIEKVNTSIFVSESYNCNIDDYGNFIIHDKNAFPNGVQAK
jgi:N-methylhydantoinase A